MANTNGTAFPAATTPYPRRCMCFGSPAKPAPPHRPRGDTRANAAASEQSLRLILTPFQNILFKNPQDAKSAETVGVPDFFADLNFDQVASEITAGRDEYNLKSFFYTLLSDIDAVAYRHEILRDLEQEKLADHVRRFARRLRDMRKHLAQSGKLYYKRQKESWFLDAVEIYCDAVN